MKKLSLESATMKMSRQRQGCVGAPISLLLSMAYEERRGAKDVGNNRTL